PLAPLRCPALSRGGEKLYVRRLGASGDRRMARLEYDSADQNVAKLFPTHGWAANSQGAKILWLPLNRLLAWPHQTLRKGGSSQPLHPGAVLAVSPFAHTLRKLQTTLRELHRLIRVSCDHPYILDEDNPEARTADLQATEMIPLLIDLAFTYLRRLPDLLVVA